MSAFPDRPNAALLVVDMQRGVVTGTHEAETVIENIRLLVAKARKEHVPVLWVQHEDEHLVKDSGNWQIVPELIPKTGEPRIEKRYGDAFEATSLEELLAGLRIGKLFVTGAQTDACIRATLHGAFVRGYDVTLVSDAHTTEDLTAWGAPPPDKVIAHTNLYWSFQAAPDKTAAVVASAKVDFCA